MPAGEHPRLHAKKLDKQLGFRIPRIEAKLAQKYRAYDLSNDITNRKQHFGETQTWIGLHPQALQTPYSEIFEAMEFLKAENVKTVVDIGAGYGRVGIVLSVVFPKANFLGFEIVKKRQNEANRIFEKNGFDQSRVLLEDVLSPSFQLPDADVYFIYDFSEIDHLIEILTLLSKKVGSEKFYLITRGDRTDHLMKTHLKNVWKVHWAASSSELKIYKLS